MTERLSSLLHDEASGLHVPAAPIREVLAGGRAIRRRRRTRVVVACAVAAVAVVAAGTAVLGLHRSDSTPQPVRLPDRTAYEQLGAWAAGDHVHVGNHTVIVPGVQQLQYSGAGVVVAGSDGYVLVTPGGEAEPLDLHLLDSPLGLPAVATDPASANLAYVRALPGSRAQAVVLDLASGEETTVGKPFRNRAGDEATGITGDLMSYYRGGNGMVVDWHTGERSQLGQYGFWQAAGVSIDYDAHGTWTLNASNGDTLLTVSVDPASTYGTVSPDGRYFAVSDTEPGITVYDIAAGTKTTIGGRVASNYGWTPDGHLVGRSPSSSELESCDPVDGECEGTGATPAGELTLVAGVPGASL